ncbi:MAG: Asp-tRNA(Asn)/Glu-tRNA(Gln) amidotransferase subunit GatB [Ruminococcaceae bacterium]|nr:Asp-tRNA(Asn)/Glu-tRNA(Gln) amidotransferase subunit GatB [Oscillospiraceae bacterium]
MKFETVIGLEVHVEMSANSKIFCSCGAKYGSEQNECVCPACCGMPGMLPVMNRRVVELGMTAGMMLNCKINRTTTFDKKSYYYPDLPASYQTTQWFAPIAVDGKVKIETANGEKYIGIKQIHMEEDAGKLVHDDWTDTTLVDFNRTSVPLIEIVSRPDLSSAKEVIAYLERLRSLLRFAGVSDCRWEMGTMRCDVNLSVRPEGSKELGVRTEMKNMNSLSAIEKAIEYESARHIDAIVSGTEELVQETRRWDDIKGKSYAMRTKETAGDYRYFPDPNLMPIVIDDAWYDEVKSTLPVLPEEKLAQYMEAGLDEKVASQLVASRRLCDVLDDAVKAGCPVKDAANWIFSDCMKLCNREKKTADELPVNGTDLAKLIELVKNGTVTRPNAARILAAMFTEGVAPEAYAEQNGLLAGGDDGKVDAVVKQVVDENPKAVADFKAGKEKAAMALFGQAMKLLNKNCDPQQLKEKIFAELGKR